MFDVWRKIEEKGAVAVPTKPAALSALGWVEIGENYPELMPAEFRGYDVYSDPHLIRESPFVRVEDHYEFHVRIDEGYSLKAWIDMRDLIQSASVSDWQDEIDDIFGERAIITCSCGVPGCLGLESQTVHVSKSMVHWAIHQYENKYELFFEREVYEAGLVGMLRDLVENGGSVAFEFGGAYWSKETFDNEVMALIERHPYFKDMWNEARI